MVRWLVDWIQKNVEPTCCTGCHHFPSATRGPVEAIVPSLGSKWLTPLPQHARVYHIFDHLADAVTYNAGGTQGMGQVPLRVNLFRVWSSNSTGGYAGCNSGELNSTSQRGESSTICYVTMRGYQTCHGPRWSKWL